MDSMANAVPATIAEQISAEHKSCCTAATNYLEHAMRCGELLAEAEAETGRG